ncbi:hypothetical protein L1887_54003 [Cichorium endivia]|nr:hypothetical protein L1887_54003 [Cichorium endivia]
MDLVALAIVVVTLARVMTLTRSLLLNNVVVAAGLVAARAVAGRAAVRVAVGADVVATSHGTARVTDTANGSVGGVAVGSRVGVSTVSNAGESLLERRHVLLVGPLATGAVDVGLRALDPTGLAGHVDRITPLVHAPQAAVLQVGWQLVASSSVMVKTAVLLAPDRNVGLELGRAALGHETNAHAGYEDVESSTTHVGTSVDHLVEERLDLARLGTGEIEHIAGASILGFGLGGHGSKSIAQLRVGVISPGLLARALELVSSATARRLSIVELRTGHNRLAIGETNGDRVIHRIGLPRPRSRWLAAIVVHRSSVGCDERGPDGHGGGDDEGDEHGRLLHGVEKNTAVGRFLSKQSKARKKSTGCKLAQQVWGIFERAQLLPMQAAPHASIAFAFQGKGLEVPSAVGCSLPWVGSTPETANAHRNGVAMQEPLLAH